MSETVASIRPTRRDLAWALLWGVLFGLSPHSSGVRLLPSIAGGVLFGVLVLGFRLFLRRRSGAVSRPALDPARAAVRLPLPVWVALAVFAAVFAPTLLWMYGQWTKSIWEDGHGLFMPVIIAYLALTILGRDNGRERDASAWGFAFLMVGLGLLVYDSAIRVHYLSALGFVASLPGLSLLLLGAGRTRRLMRPLLLAWLMVPLPNFVATYVQLPNAIAWGVEPTLQALGVPVVRHEASLVLPQATYGVSDNCSGIAALHAAVGASILLAFYSRSRLRRAALLLAPWPLTVLANVLRLSVVLLGEYHGIPVVRLPLHGLSGIIAFWLVLGGMFALADRRMLREALT